MAKYDEVNRERVAIVIGASSGIGLGITRALLERGFRVNTVSPGIMETPMHANNDHQALRRLHSV